MSKQQLISSFNLLESNINRLCQLLQAQKDINAAVFSLPETLKGDENNDVNSIFVDKHTGHDAITQTTELFKLLFIHKKSELVSNKTAIRLPGAICLAPSYAEYKQFQQLISDINQLKIDIKQIVTHVDEVHRFEFIRESLHGLLTLNTYRTLTSVVDPDTIRFGWANKKVINKVTQEEMLNRLQASLESGRTPAHLQREHWQLQLETEIQLVRSLPHDCILKTQRPVKVQPIARVWDKETQKQTQYSCATPILVFAVDKALSDIKLGELADYHQDSIALRNRPKAKPVELLIPRLNLYIER
ncbi:DNA replication terminus site-binding protein [Providencia sp. wls1943]|uniref:DNA replication terminus site-binding protein n=1 Tax=Providencia sp. wls1943 TaxID=2675150 RepID=UPI0012B653C5|nr:DNA replication terminus site-binding protein [Providencia sp. wls1943]MTB65829.1 DNA replication terminus site-binding protein [Providencia sp. wls1943]